MPDKKDGTAEAREMQEHDEDECKPEKHGKRRRQPEQLRVAEAIERFREIADPLVAAGPDEARGDGRRSLKQIKAAKGDDERLDLRQVDDAGVEEAAKRAGRKSQQDR
ncbi:hypothetical protein D3C87_1668200 [compost metagenome]